MSGTKNGLDNSSGGKPTKLRRRGVVPAGEGQNAKGPTARKGEPLEVVTCDTVLYGLGHTIRALKVSVDDVAVLAKVDKRIVKDMTRSFAVSEEVGNAVHGAVLELHEKAGLIKPNGSEFEKLTGDALKDRFPAVRPSPALERVPSIWNA